MEQLAEGADGVSSGVLGSNAAVRLTAEKTTQPSEVSAPLRAQGKFLLRGDEKLYVRGVTYGTFRPAPDGGSFPSPKVVRRDFAVMAANGVNAVRTYTVPPRWLLDTAHGHGILVMVGIPWEQHIAFLGERGRAGAIEERVRRAVRACAGHPAVLCYTIGNEIPAPIVRWHGRRRVERFLERLYLAAKDEEPAALVTYANFPSTEYLQLPFLDLVCFNVFVEAEPQLEAYLARLQNIAGDRPLVVSELGLDSRRNGERRQMESLEAQLRLAFAGGCAGTFVFSWTDEWHRDGRDVDDWDFGLIDRQSRPKPALAAVRRSFAAVPFPRDTSWPRVSVIVCTHNGARTLRDCLDGVRSLDYPDFEMIVVDDGSADASAAIAEEYDAIVLRTENRGLSAARNLGLRAATGAIVAYVDDDARPDPHWLQYLAATFLLNSHAGVGGPNIAPPTSGYVSSCVAHSPGGPTHVLLSDREAEHLPGCNLAFRRERLEEIGGFDPRFRVAGDDVDVCWRLREHGYTLGFHPGAMVWHKRRSSVRAFFKQQRGYGRAEALLEQKWPERYNRGGHPTWGGRVYGGGVSAFRRWRIYTGTEGSSLFQQAHERHVTLLSSLPRMPEWYLVIIAFAALTALGAAWKPFLAFAAPLVLAVAALLAQAFLGAWRASVAERRPGRRRRLAWLILNAYLRLMQPFARLAGRLEHGLTPWRRRRGLTVGLPVPRERAVWDDGTLGKNPPALLAERLRNKGIAVRRGDGYERWDLRASAGTLGAARVRIAVEDHGAAGRLFRFRVWPRCWGGASIVGAIGAIAAGEAAEGGSTAAAITGVIAAAVALEALRQIGASTASVLVALSTELPVVAEPEAEAVLELIHPAPRATQVPMPVVVEAGERAGVGGP